MSWLSALASGSAVATAVLVLGLVVSAGLAIGTVKIYGIRLGVAGVLFAGLLFGHLGLTIHPTILDFARDFGLVLFVYGIGAQVGPGFLASLRRQGLALNLLAVGVVLLGTAIALLVWWLSGIELPVVVGLLAGATTNTPSLAAAQQALQALPRATAELTKLPGMGYAAAYPFGVIGLILAMVATRALFRIKIADEVESLQREQEREHPHLATMHMMVDNKNLDGVALRDVPLLEESGVVVSRILHDAELSLATPDTLIHLGDVLLTVGERSKLDDFRLFIGSAIELDLSCYRSDVVIRRLIVTKKSVLGRGVNELGLMQRFGVKVTRVARMEIEFTPTNDTHLHYGDVITVVGSPKMVDEVAEKLGNSPKELGHPKIASMFLGIALGIAVGSIPLQIPGAPAPIRLGMAGGPLVVAILLSWVGQVGPVVWYLPQQANFMLREVGIALFLSCVGLRAGDSFVATLVHGSGFRWMAWAALITLIPALVVALVARLRYRSNFAVLCGVLAGSMTDPPALAFAGDYTGSEAPSSAYATVYPLTMILRVFIMQLLVIFLLR